MQKIGVIGLGIMGAPMARNLKKAGFDLTVYNRGAERLAPFRAEGTEIAASPKALAEQVEAIVIMVTGPAALAEVVAGPHGLTETNLTGKVVINVSTVSINATEAAASHVEAAGGAFVDAPVSGSKIPAEKGELVFLAGAEESLLADIAPLLEAMGRKTVHCGPIGSGTRMKLAVNLMLTGMMHALAEAFIIGRTLGVEPARFLEALGGGVLNAPLFQMKGPLLMAGEFPPQFPLEHAFKDLDLLLDEAARDGVALPGTEAVWESFNTAMEQGLGKEDFAAVIKAIGMGKG